MMRRRLISGKAPEMEQNVDESLLNKSWDQTDNAVSQLINLIIRKALYFLH